MIEFQAQSDLRRLGDTIEKTAAFSKKSVAVILADATTQITIGGNNIKGLYQEFKAIRPNPDADIRSAPWGIGRTFRKYGDRSTMGVSIAAQRRAEDILQGKKSLLFRITRAKGVLGKPVPLITGSRGKNILYDPRKGGSRKYAKTKTRPDEKRLNLRALSVYYELQLRATGTGFSAAQFAISRSILGLNLRRAADAGASVRLRQQRNNGHTIGIISFDANHGARITGYLDLRSNVGAIETRVIRAVMVDKEQRLSNLILKKFTEIQ